MYINIYKIGHFALNMYKTIFISKWKKFEFGKINSKKELK